MATDIVELYVELIKQLDPESAIYTEGCSEQDISDIEYDIGHKLPADLKNIYTSFDGESDAEIGVFSGYIFLDIDSIRPAIEELEEGSKYFDAEEKYPCYPPKTVKKQSYNSNWIPFAMDGSGNFIGVDFDPDINGVKGQIVNFGSDQFVRVQIATDLRHFIEELLIGYKKNKYHDGFYKGSMDIVSAIIDKHQKLRSRE